MTNWALVKEESSFVTKILRMSMLSFTIQVNISNLFLIELIFICPIRICWHFLVELFSNLQKRPFRSRHLFLNRTCSNLELIATGHTRTCDLTFSDNAPIILKIKTSNLSSKIFLIETECLIQRLQCRHWGFRFCLCFFQQTWVFAINLLVPKRFRFIYLCIYLFIYLFIFELLELYK